MFSRKTALRLLVTALVGAVLLSLSYTTMALAADLRGGGSPTVAAGETVDQDVYIAGNTVSVDGAVNGDVQAAGNQITVNGVITGSVNAAGGTVTFNGTASRAVRVAASTVDVGGKVGRDVLAAGAMVTTEKTASIAGDLLIEASSATIDGTIGGSIHGGGTYLTIAGHVGGDVIVNAGQLTLEPGAVVNGNVYYTSNSEIINNGEVGGRVERTAPGPGLFESFFWRLPTFFMALIFGMVVVALFPRPSRMAAESIREKPWSSLLWGFLAMLVPPTAAAVLAITIIGFPLSVVTLLLWAIAIYVSQVFVSLIVGILFLQTSRTVESRLSLVMAFAVGFIVLSAVTSVLKLVPGLFILSELIDVAILLLGMGSIWLTVGRLYRRPAEPAPEE